MTTGPDRGDTSLTVKRGHRGADLVVRSLLAEGATTIFSLSGNQIMPVYDALIGTDLRLVHVRHEAAAVHMADAFGQLTGEPGIALVTAGPGFANGLSALYGAFRAESPMVLLAGHASASELGRGAFQEMPQSELAAPFAKASWLARDPAKLGADIARAMRLARSGRPGPVQISLPFDVLEARTEVEATAPAHHEAGAVGKVTKVAAVVARVKSARRPLIFHGPSTGRGRLGEQVRALGRRWGVPVVGMSSPRGLKDPALGALAEVLPEADLIVLLGKHADYMLRFASPPAVGTGTRFIHLDPDEAAAAQAGMMLGERLEFQLRGDLPALVEALSSAAIQGDRAWLDAVEAAVATRMVRGSALLSKPAGPLHPADVARAVQPILDRSDKSVLILDGGEFGQWAQAHLTAPRRITNGPAGAIGASLPFAIAARIVEPDAPVVALMGDGTVGFHLSELDTAVRAATPLMAIVGNDARWNAEHEIQLRDYGASRTIGCELLPTRYDRVAEAFGAFGAHVDRPEELAPALAAAQASGQPALVDVAIEPHAAPAPKPLRS